MELFEKVKKHKELKESEIKAKKEIRQIILENFVNLRYQTELTQAGYLGHRDNKENIKVYYPVLSLPEGFSKEKEIFFREYANVVKHQYTLVDESGRKILAEEKACFLTNIVRKDENGNEIRISLNSYIISELISYNFEIEGENYCIKRNFGYEEMLEQVLEDKTASYSNFSEYYYEKEEKAYEEYLESLETKKEDIIPLREIVNSKVEEQQITPLFTACFEACQNEFCNNSDRIILKNPQFSVRIADSKIKYAITVKIVTTKNRVSLSEKVFEYEEEKSKTKYQNGCTLHEIFELFK